MTEHYTILTDKGASKIAEAIRVGQKIEITQMALGDGDGSLPKPQSNATSLVKERYRASINSAKVDEHNNAWVIFEQVLAPDIGGWWIREVGLYDKDGDLIAIGNYPEQYKPLLTEGASTTQTVSIVIQVLSSDAITLKIDPSVVLATRQYVDDHVNLLTIKNESVKELIYNESRSREVEFNNIRNELTPRAGSIVHTDDWNSLISPGVYKVTPGDGGPNENAPPAGYWYGLLLVEMSGQAIIQQYIQHRGLRTFQRMNFNNGINWDENWAELGVEYAGSIIYTASQRAPSGYLVADGAAISRKDYANLFNAIGTTFGSGNGSTTFNVPDLRGEFIRGWDKDRGIDSGRVFGSQQSDELKSHSHNINTTSSATSYNDNVDPMRGSMKGTVATNSNSITATGGNETRPRNVALLACIKY